MNNYLFFLKILTSNNITKITNKIPIETLYKVVEGGLHDGHIQDELFSNLLVGKQSFIKSLSPIGILKPHPFSAVPLNSI